MGWRAQGATRHHQTARRTLARLILDTTVLVDAERAPGTLEQLIDDEDDVAIAAITAAELLVGVELASPGRRQTREHFVSTILNAIPIEVYDLDVATEHARLLALTQKQGTPRGAHDLIIAATARAKNRTILTLDQSGFKNLPSITVLPLATD